MTDRPAYVPLPESAFRTLCKLSPAQCQTLIRFIGNYAFGGIEPKGEGAAQAIFELMRDGLDRAMEEVGQ